MLYSAQQPTRDPGGYLKVSYGSYNAFTAEGALNLPISTWGAIRLSGNENRRDGFQHNLLLGIAVNSVDTQVGRASLLIAPQGSILTNVTMVQIGHSGGRTGAVKMTEAYGANGAPSTYYDPITQSTQPLDTISATSFPTGIVTVDPRVNALFNGIGDFLNKQKSVGFYDYYAENDQKFEGHQSLVTNTTTLDFGPGAIFKNIFGYNNVYSWENATLTGGPYEYLAAIGGTVREDQGYTAKNKDISDELQISGKIGDLNYISGVYYSHSENLIRIPLSVLAILGNPFLGRTDFTTTDESRAVYGQLGYALTSRLNLSGGFRYTWEKIRIVQAPDSLYNILNDGHLSESKPSWSVGFDYHATDSLMLYFTQRGSWRSGGFNGTSAASYPDAASFKPETTFDFEIGAKFAGRIGGLRSHFNIALYDQYIHDVQRAPYLNISALAGNVNEARVRGVELDGGINLTSWLEVGGAFTYTDAQYTDPNATVAGANFVFGPYGDVPKYTGSAHFRASDKMSDGGELALRGEIYAQSSFYYSNLANTILPDTSIAGYAIANGRIEWNNITGSRVNAAFYVNNIFQAHYNVGGFPLGAVTGTNGTMPGTPRMFGMEVGMKF